MSISNHSATSSRKTLGAKGRKDSRYLTLRLSSFCMVGERGSARMLLPPSARGPNSIRPLCQPTALPSANAWAACSIASSSVWVVNTAPQSARRRATSSWLYCGPKYEPFMPSSAVAGLRGWFSMM